MIFKLVLSSYFWMVVSAARREWIENNERDESFIVTSSSPVYGLNNANVPKTPSYLSSNIGIIFEEPKPLVPPKYNVV